MDLGQVGRPLQVRLGFGRIIDLATTRRIPERPTAVLMTVADLSTMVTANVPRRTSSASPSEMKR